MENIWDLIQEGKVETHKTDVEKFLAKDPDGFVYANKKYNLKAGDVICFKGGYNNDINFISKIFAKYGTIQHIKSYICI